MEKRTVEAMVPGKGDVAQIGPCTIEVNFGATADESIKMFGDEAVNSNAFANWRVTLQANIRSGLKRGETPAQIQARLAEAKMGVSAQGVRIDPVQAYLAKFSTSTPAEQQKMLKELQEKAKISVTAPGAQKK